VPIIYRRTCVSSSQSQLRRLLQKPLCCNLQKNQRKLDSFYHSFRTKPKRWTHHLPAHRSYSPFNASPKKKNSDDNAERLDNPPNRTPHHQLGRALPKLIDEYADLRRDRRKHRLLGRCFIHGGLLVALLVWFCCPWLTVRCARFVGFQVLFGCALFGLKCRLNSCVTAIDDRIAEVEESLEAWCKFISDACPSIWARCKNTGVVTGDVIAF
jgi:hypothetical protein